MKLDTTDIIHILEENNLPIEINSVNIDSINYYISYIKRYLPTKTKTINKKYTAKSLATLLRKFNSGSYSITAENDFIVAMIYSGFVYKSGYFNISIKEVNKIQSLLNY